MMQEGENLNQEPKFAEFDPSNHTWRGVEPRQYKDSTGDVLNWQGVTRHTLLRPEAGEAAFEVRYFEIAPHGFSSLEKHNHIHAVTILRGRGRVLIGNTLYEAKPLDFFYIPPQVPHQFLNDGTEPFGFMCVVNVERDRPQPLSPEELNQVRHVLKDALAHQ